MSFNIDWNGWEPLYTEILVDFGFDRNADEQARDELATLCSDGVLAVPDLPDVVDERVIIAGGADSLDEEMQQTSLDGRIFGTSTATSRLRKHGVDVDLHVTDLDKDEFMTRRRTESGKPVVLHAHGDNRSALREHVPHMDTRYLTPTTQAHPTDLVHNPGGFTDGDRAAFIADALGAGELGFIGWDFDDPSVDAVKREKLRWAARLLCWLEAHRQEQFDILDGRRKDIDMSGFPALRREH